MKNKKNSSLKKSGKKPVLNKKVEKNKLTQTLAPKGEEAIPKNSELSTETAEATPMPPIAPMTSEIAETPPTVDFSKAFTLENDTLQKRTAEQIGSDSEYPPVERMFKSENELTELVLNNAKILFGENAVIVDFTGKTDENKIFPNKFLFDVKDLANPKFYIIETLLSKQTLGYLFAIITHFFALFKTYNARVEFIAKVWQMAEKCEGTMNELEERIGGKSKFYDFTSNAIKRKPTILLVMDNDRQELTLFTETYEETWGKSVKPVIIRKFRTDDEIIYTMTPDFTGVWKDAGKKREKDNTVYTEEHHFKQSSETVKIIYETIKTELLKKDNTIEFRVKKFYISVRKGRNLAFFHLKKKIKLVIMLDETVVRKELKYHTIKSLPESVQKFWNGKCCEIIIENSGHLNEVINLLKKLIAQV